MGKADALPPLATDVRDAAIEDVQLVHNDEDAAFFILPSSKCSDLLASASLVPAEGPVSGETYYLSWRVMTQVAIAAESLIVWKERSDIVRADVGAELARLWDAYRVVRASPAKQPNESGINARLVVSFRSNAGVVRWMAVGREYPVIQTEDHVCHPVDRKVFRDLVDMLGIRDTIVQGRGHDPAMAKYLE
jgi:hypothetical protein